MFIEYLENGVRSKNVIAYSSYMTENRRDYTNVIQFD